MRNVANGSRPSFSINAEKLLHAIVDVVCVIDLQGFFRYVSPSGKQLFGYEPADMVDASFLKFIHPDDVEKTVKLAAERTPDCRTSNFENRYIRKDGSVIHVLWSGRWDEQDDLLYCVARDGSDKSELENRLLKAQQMARVANYEYDFATGIYTYLSDTFFEIFGLTRHKGNFTATDYLQMIHPDDLAWVKENLWAPEKDYATKMEYRVVRPDGKIVYISRLREAIFDKEGRPVKSVGTIQDITDRKLSELAVQQSEERFRSLVQNGNDLMGIINLEGTYLFVGDNVQHHLGYSAEELVGKNVFQFIHPEDTPLITAALSELKEQPLITVGPFRYRNSSDEWRWVVTTVSNHLNNPVIGGLVTNSKDVTDKKLHDDALQISEQRFKALVQNSSDLIVILDVKANFLYCSDNVTSLLGYEPCELKNRNAYDFIHPDDIERVVAELNQVLQEADNTSGVQHRFLHKKGEWVWLESKGTNRLLTESIHGILVNSRNITDRVKLQKRLHREVINKQKEITSAVIKAQEAERSQLGLELHDNVNQILTTVKLYNEMYLTGYVQDMELLRKSAQYTQDCINEIRSISKRLSAPMLGRISLQDSIRELIDSINLTGRLEIIYMPKGIEECCISQDMHLTIYRIVQEALNNIIKYSQAQVACVQILRRGGQIHLAISDNGKGFDTTTKRTGIGITNMKTRAEHLHGEFHIRSEAGKGCEIDVYFPCEGCMITEKKKATAKA